MEPRWNPDALLYKESLEKVRNELEVAFWNFYILDTRCNLLKNLVIVSDRNIYKNIFLQVPDRKRMHMSIYATLWYFFLNHLFWYLDYAIMS